jgi:hypothetical protein
MDFSTYHKSKQWDNFNMELYLNYLEAKYNGVEKSIIVTKTKKEKQNSIINFLKSFVK